MGQPQDLLRRTTVAAMTKGDKIMHIHTFYKEVELYRNDKILYARFLVPHRVISTCQVAGGIREDMDILYNHQSCEPSGHHSITSDIMAMDRSRYREYICEQYGLDPEKCATLGTAANMRNAAVKQARFRDLTVAAVCTGGVEGNAGRAGDPASHFEHDGKFEKLPEKQPKPVGTINTMIFINKELIPGALARAIMMATEAKTAVLQELLVPSLYSDGHATGTGTDQIGVACRMDTGKPLTSAGKHGKLGELIGLTVHDAIKETLAQQNGLFPGTRRSVAVLLQRLGMTEQDIRDQVSSHLVPEDAELWPKVEGVVLGDALVVAAVAALVHIRDQMVWEIIPDNCLPEILASYGAQIAAAVSCKHKKILAYRSRADSQDHSLENSVFTGFICRMLALGFSDKWKERVTPEGD